MDSRFEETFLADVVALEAEARGLQSRLAELAALREDDGLTETEAAADAAESIGLTESIRDHLSAPFASLVDPPIDTITFVDAHGGMPEWRRDGTAAIVALTPATLHELGPVVERLRAAIDVDPERLSVALAVGLGGTGGCACGDELPEDAPAGPLFERR
jgi:hypothetical protein